MEICLYFNNYLTTPLSQQQRYFISVRRVVRFTREHWVKWEMSLMCQEFIQIRKNFMWKRCNCWKPFRKKKLVWKIRLKYCGGCSFAMFGCTLSVFWANTLQLRLVKYSETTWCENGTILWEVVVVFKTQKLFITKRVHYA